MPGLFSKTQRPFRRINVRDFETMRTGARPPFIVDVREPFELKAFGAIPGIVNIPLGDLARSTSKLPRDKSTPIVVVCQSGSRSLTGAATLVKLGYLNVASLDGGTMGWLRARR